MLFRNINNTGAFFRTIGECQGNVVYLDAQGARRDLKQLAAQLLHADFLTQRGIPALEVLVDNPQDGAQLMRFMMEGRGA